MKVALEEAKQKFLEDFKTKFLKEILDYIYSFFKVYRKRKIGFILGLMLGILILVLGPFNTFFIAFCGIIGLYIGSRFDDGDDLVGKTLKAIEDALPESWRH